MLFVVSTFYVDDRLTSSVEVPRSLLADAGVASGDNGCDAVQPPPASAPAADQVHRPRGTLLSALVGQNSCDLYVQI